MKKKQLEKIINQQAAEIARKDKELRTYKENAMQIKLLIESLIGK